MREDPVARLVGVGGLEAVVMSSGDVIGRAGLFASPMQELRSDLPCRAMTRGRRTWASSGAPKEA